MRSRLDSSERPTASANDASSFTARSPFMVDAYAPALRLPFPARCEDRPPRERQVTSDHTRRQGHAPPHTTRQPHSGARLVEMSRRVSGMVADWHAASRRRLRANHPPATTGWLVSEALAETAASAGVRQALGARAARRRWIAPC